MLVSQGEPSTTSSSSRPFPTRNGTSRSAWCQDPDPPESQQFAGPTRTTGRAIKHLLWKLLKKWTPGPAAMFATLPCRERLGRRGLPRATALAQIPPVKEVDGTNQFDSNTKSCCMIDAFLSRGHHPRAPLANLDLEGDSRATDTRRSVAGVVIVSAAPRTSSIDDDAASLSPRCRRCLAKHRELRGRAELPARETIARSPGCGRRPPKPKKSVFDGEPTSKCAARASSRRDFEEEKPARLQGRAIMRREKRKFSRGRECASDLTLYSNPGGVGLVVVAP